MTLIQRLEAERNKPEGEPEGEPEDSQGTLTRNLKIACATFRAWLTSHDIYSSFEHYKFGAGTVYIKCDGLHFKVHLCEAHSISYIKVCPGCQKEQVEFNRITIARLAAVTELQDPHCLACGKMVWAEMIEKGDFS